MSEKPKFDPSQPFQAAEKPKFDPSQPFHTPDQGAPSDISELESALRGAAQGASFNLAPALVGGVSAIPAALGALSGHGAPSDILARYRQARDEFQKKADQAQEANPASFIAGNVVGGLAPAVLTGGLSEGATLGGLAKQGAMYGAASGAGEAISKGEDLRQGIQDATKSGLLGAATGGLVGGAGKLIGEGAKGAMSAARKAARMSTKQAEAYTANPEAVHKMAQMLQEGESPQLQDEAAAAIKNSMGILKNKGLSKSEELSKLLEGKNATINPEDYRGISPEIDAILDKAQAKSPESSAAEAFKYLGNSPSQAEIPANDLNAIKRLLQEEANYGKGTILDPVRAAKNEEMGQLASKARSAVESAGGEGVSGLNEEMQKNILLQKELQKGLNNPLAFTTTESADRLANIARAEQQGAGGISEFGNKLGAAKAISTKDVDDSITRMVVKTAGRTALRAGKTVGDSSKYLTSLPKEGLANLGATFSASENPLAQKLGTILTNSSQKDDIGRNALIFTLMQNPGYRHLLDGVINKD